MFHVKHFMGHARALLAIKNPEEQIKIAEYIIENNLSVRETEKYVQSYIRERKRKRKERKKYRKE